MIIDFENIPWERLEHFKGGEGALNAQMYWDGTTRIFHGLLEPGSSIGLHRHEGTCEMIFVVRGQATLLEDGERKTIHAGQCTYCPESHEHSLINNSSEEIEFYAAIPQQK